MLNEWQTDCHKRSQQTQCGHQSESVTSAAKQVHWLPRTKTCILLLQKTWKLWVVSWISMRLEHPPRNTQKPVVERRVSTQLPQSASAKAVKLRAFLRGKNKP